MSDEERYEPFVTVGTEGQGFIGLMTCKRCGACVMFDQVTGEKPVKLHDEWHEAVDLLKDAAITLTTKHWEMPT